MFDFQILQTENYLEKLVTVGNGKCGFINKGDKKILTTHPGECGVSYYRQIFYIQVMKCLMIRNICSSNNLFV